MSARGTTFEAWDAAPVDVLNVPGIVCMEWACWHCGASGPGYMPEEHASRACEPTRTMPRMDPEVARATQHMVRTMLDGALYMDGGGI